MKAAMQETQTRPKNHLTLVASISKGKCSTSLSVEILHVAGPSSPHEHPPANGLLVQRNATYPLGAFGSLLGIDGGFLAHSREDNDVWTVVSMQCREKLCCSGNALVSLPSSVKSLLILSPTSPSGSLTSSLVEPSSDMRERKPSSVTSS